MALPASGAISFSQINTELGVSATAARSLNDATTRTLFGVASGAISMSNGYGKANQFAFAIASNQTNANLRTLAVNAGWNQTTKVVATIDSGIYVSSSTTGTPALTVNGSFPGGVELTNNGYIVGMGGPGGSGGNGSTGSTGVAGSGGGLALIVSVAVAVRNNGTIGGGGGGGGGGGTYYEPPSKYGGGYGWGGGGGGGGRSGTSNSSGGPAGDSYTSRSRVGTAGSGGTSASGGAGGLSHAAPNFSFRGGDGGAGGGWGAAGSSGSAGIASEIPSGSSGGGGGGGGAAVSGNVNITWLATGTRLGAIS